MKVVIIVLVLGILTKSEAAKILAVFVTPSISHQVVFRPFTQELAKRSHELIVITADPVFSNEDLPKNLKEIDVHDLLYAVANSRYKSMQIAEGTTIHSQFKNIFEIISWYSYTFLTSKVIDELRKENFDLMITEAYNKQILLLSYILDIPVMQISSFGSLYDYETVGAPWHPFLYPEVHTQRINNLTVFEKVKESYVNLVLKNEFRIYNEEFDKFTRKLDRKMLLVDEMLNKVTTLLLNVQPIWEENRPIPVGVSYVGGLHRWPKHSMSEDLETYFNASKNGVVYVSFGTNVHPSLLPKERTQVLLDGLAKLPYDVLLKWDQELVEKPDNVKVGKWFPQIAILEHPKLKLFVTQCGLQSTEEAIDAGVPMIGIPFMFDQWTNAEKYVRHKIGVKLEIETLTEKEFLDAVNTVIEDKSYRENIQRFRTLMRDQPHSALKLATWWTEYVLRHSGAAHLRAPAANLTWTQYLELELVCIVLFASLVALVSFVFVSSAIVKMVLRHLGRKIKSN